METPVVLLVSRDEDTLIVFGTVLRHAGFRVRELADPAVVCDRIVAERPSLVVTDFPTPAGDVTVTELIRGDCRMADIPILNVTSHVMPSELQRAHEAGVNASLLMPVPLTQLVEEVRRLVQDSGH